MYTITRQLQWPDGARVVEVSEGDINYVNPDALVQRYPGEFEQFERPMEAIKTAITICRAWRKDGQKNVKVAIGCTHGMTMPFEPTTFKKLVALGRKLEADYKEEAERKKLSTDSDEEYCI